MSGLSMSHETNPILEKPGTTSQMETGICDAANLAGGVFMLKGDVLNRDKRKHVSGLTPFMTLPPGEYSMIVDEDGTVSCTLEEKHVDVIKEVMVRADALCGLFTPDADKGDVIVRLDGDYVLPLNQQV